MYFHSNGMYKTPMTMRLEVEPESCTVCWDECAMVTPHISHRIFTFAQFFHLASLLLQNDILITSIKHLTCRSKEAEIRASYLKSLEQGECTIYSTGGL